MIKQFRHSNLKNVIDDQIHHSSKKSLKKVFFVP